MKRKKVLKVFVWEDFSRDYTSGLAVAIAENEAQARKMVCKAYGAGNPDFGGAPLVRRLGRCAFAVGGGG